MKTEQKTITGSEKRAGRTSPYDALSEFYDAFNNQKADLMEQNWAGKEEIAMDNPLGGIIRGRENIMQVYRRIFEGPAKVYVEFYDYSLHQTPEIFYAVGRERGYFESGGKRLELAIRTSRIFQKSGGEWRQVHHHGSIEAPALLKAYQDIVKK